MTAPAYTEVHAAANALAAAGNAPWTIGAIQAELRADWLTLHTDNNRGAKT